MSQVPTERLVDPMETASHITYLLPAVGAIRYELNVDGGRLSEFESSVEVKPNRIMVRNIVI